MADSTASPACALCGGPLDEHDRDRGTCHDCRSPKGKIADLDIAIRASGDDPKRISDWNVIQHWLRKRFGDDRSDTELWERCTGWLRAEGRLTPNDYLPLPLNYLLWLLENGFPRPEQAGNGKLEALHSFERELENWNCSNSPSETGYVVEDVPIGHPLHTAVVALQPFYGGALPKPALGHWRTFLKLARNGDETAEDEAELLLEWVNSEIESHNLGLQPDHNHAEIRIAGDLWKALDEGKAPSVAVSAISLSPPFGPNIAQPKFRKPADQPKWDVLDRALADKSLVDFRELAGLTPPPRTLSGAASRLVDLLDDYLRVLQIGWEIPPGFPADRFVPSVSFDRDRGGPIVQYLFDLGFTGDARRMHEAMQRCYDIRDWRIMMPSPSDDKGWQQFQQRYVEPLKYEAARLQSVISEARQLIIMTATMAKPPNGQNTPTKSITNSEAEALARRLDKKDITFRHLTAKQMAALIQHDSGKLCSDSLVKQLPFWAEVMTATGRGRKRGSVKGQGQKRGTAARPMNFSKDLEAATGEGETHEVLEELVEAEETAKAERALREQTQAIALVNRSRLSPKEKTETIANLEAGTMTAQQAGDMVSLLHQDPVLNKKKHPS